MSIEFRPNGPHSSTYTLTVGNAFDEAVRVLNYATMEGNDGLPYPGTAYSLLGSLYSGVGKMDQLLSQLGVALARQQAAGLLRVRGGRFDGHPDEAVAAFGDALGQARAAAEALHQALTAAQSAVASVSMVDPVGPGAHPET